MRALRVALAASLVFFAGCLSPPVLPPRPDTGIRDAGFDAWLPHFAVLDVVMTDARGQARPAEAAPRTPSITITFASPPSDVELVLLVQGDADDDLVSDLDATPYRASTLERAVPVTATLRGATLTLAPTHPLDRGQTVTVAIPRWLTDANAHHLDALFTRTMTVATTLDAGAVATDAWPPDGASDVAPALALAAIRFDGTIDDPAHAITLSAVHGGIVPCSPMLTPCTSIGWPDGACVELVPLAPLAASTAHVVAVSASARDATGAALPAFASHFTTAASEPSPLTWSLPTCGLGEIEAMGGCARADDESIVFRGQLSAAARLVWTAGSAHGTSVAPRGTVLLRASDLAPSTLTPLALIATDYAGGATSLTLPLSTTEPLPTLSITEVRADPAGLEPRQEFVEIENYGTAAVSLAGMHLADSLSAVGDALPIVSIPAGARALIVAADFNPDDTTGGDVPAPPGALLVRVDASLGSGGLSNSGEPVFLRDAMSRWISAAPATPAPRQAICIVRTSASHRTGEPGSFGYDPALTCTPGH